MKYRIGNGYDVHRLEAGRKLILGGVEIPYEKGLLGHSDADVLIHAIIDSILGASALGDIGKMFPDTDESYKDVSSIELLKKAYDTAGGKGFKIENIDSVIIAQSPKLSPYIEDMRKNISRAISVEVSKISVKATTEEFLGFTGAGEGIAAHAVCMLSYFGF